MIRTDLDKAISVKQPWAYLLCANIKPIENRTWPLPEKHIGKRVYIHASGTLKKFSINLTDEQMLASFGALAEESINGNFSFGAIIGYVEFSECVINHPSIWAEKTPDYVVGINPKIHDHITGRKIIYNWVVANAVLFDKPILDVKGRLSFWDCSEYITSAISELRKDGKLLSNEDIDEITSVNNSLPHS